MTRRIFDYLAIAILLLLTAISFYWAPKMGDFSYSDASRHALNGVFILDFLHAFPMHAPMDYANAYYQHFPALTIGFYPPLVSLVMAGFYALFGVSHQTAQLCISFFLAGLGLGCYVLARNTLNAFSALAVAILTMTAPVICNWGSQVMLDIPAACLLIWTVIYFCKWLQSGNKTTLLCTVALFVAALYTKQTIAFFALAALATLFYRQQSGLLRHKFAALLLAAALISLIPLAMLSYVFGRVNMESVAGARAEDMSLFSINAWTYYVSSLPESVGWPVTILGLGGLCFAATQWRYMQKNAPDHLVVLLWFIGGYVFYSLIALRISRNLVQLVYPLAYFSVWSINRLDSMISWRKLAIASLSMAVVSGYKNMTGNHVQWVDGYRQAAEFVEQNNPTGSRVFFHGYRDGSFIYNLRVAGGEQVAPIVRSDKLFLKLKIERERGVKDLGVLEQDMIRMLHQQKISLVVAQKDFWTDLPTMSRFEQLLANEKFFHKIKTISIHSNFSTNDKELGIYRFIDDQQLP